MVFKRASMREPRTAQVYKTLAREKSEPPVLRSTSEVQVEPPLSDAHFFPLLLNSQEETTAYMRCMRLSKNLHWVSPELKKDVLGQYHE
jgi:hypothetical protein